MADQYEAKTKEAKERLEGCEAQKREFDLDIRESYFFTAPHRAREIRSAQAISQSKPKDADLLQTGLAMELSEDFGTGIVDAFMPPWAPWAEQRPGMFLPDEHRDEVKKAVGNQDPKIFDAIRASNLYEEIPKAFNPDLSIGTTAIWIDDTRPAENIVVQAIPLHELEINVGPHGEIDDRFVVRHTKNRHVEALLGAVIYAKLSDEQHKKIKAKPREKTIIRWGFWRLWDRFDDIVWQHVVMLGDKVVHAVELEGEGCCKLLVMRFNPSPEWAYGQGPTPKSLPDFRQLDDLEAKKIQFIDKQLAPPSTYPDDSFTAIEQGIETGMMYPIRPGSEDAVKPIFPPGSMEAAIFETAEKERMLRHRYYLDFPEQRGKTPPTATQWLDEMTRLQKRIGTPGSSFWREGPAQIFLRFKYILEKRGIIDPIVVNGKTVSLQPYNPAQRAAEQQEVAMFARFAEIVAGLFPEEWRLDTDGRETMNAVAEKMRVTGLWKIRPADQKQAALGMIAKLIEGKQRLAPSDPAAAGQL